MVSIDFSKFQTESEFRSWLYTEDGYRVLNHIYDIVVSCYGRHIRYIPAIVKKDHDGTVYSVDMKNISGFCTNAIQYFEAFEEYEKCETLLKILKSNKPC